MGNLRTQSAAARCPGAHRAETERRSFTVAKVVLAASFAVKEKKKEEKTKVVISINLLSLSHNKYKERTFATITMTAS